MKTRITLAIFLISICLSCTSNEQVKQEPKVKNIILMIGDGMGVTQIYAAYTANHGNLNLEKAQYIGLSKTYAADKYETDSGAGGTAIAIGKKTNDGAIGVDSLGIAHESILEKAKRNGLSTGLIATSTITHATPASFIAHQQNRYMYGEIAKDFIDSDIDIFIGGGRSHFEDSADINILDVLRLKNYSIVFELDDINPADTNNIACLPTELYMPKASGERGDFLPSATKLALEKLSANEKGFFVMIEGSQIDWGGHNNDLQYVIDETIDFDKAVGEAFKFADEHPGTLVIVTADHETGGLSITGGNIETGEVEAHFSTDYHTGVMVPVFSYGTGAEKFAGMYENTDIFHKMLELYSFDEK